MLAHHTDLVGDKVGAVEADAELADPDPVVGVPKRSKKTFKHFLGARTLRMIAKRELFLWDFGIEKLQTILDCTQKHGNVATSSHSLHKGFGARLGDCSLGCC